MHLAQINVGRLVAPEGSPEVAEFIDALDEINALAERSAGFVRTHGPTAQAFTFASPFPA